MYIYIRHGEKFIMYVFIRRLTITEAQGEFGQNVEQIIFCCFFRYDNDSEFLYRAV